MKKRWIYSLMFGSAMLITGCGSADEAQQQKSLQGRLVDAPVAGVRYECRHATGVTDANGTFHCDALPVHFYLGTLEIGSIGEIPEDGLVFPQDICGLERNTTEGEALRIAQLIQSLDDDGIIEDHITIPTELPTTITDRNLSISQLTEAEFSSILQNADFPVSAQEARTHLIEQMARYGLPFSPYPAEENGNEDSFQTPENHEGMSEGNFSEPAPSSQESADAHPHPPHSDEDQYTELNMSHEDSIQYPEQAAPEEDESSVTQDEASSSNDTWSIPPIDPATQTAYLEAINNARAQEQDCGPYGVFPPAPALQWSDTLYRAAYEHSYDMAVSNTFSHTGSGTQSDITAVQMDLQRGSRVSERLEANGYTSWRAYGENIAAGTDMEEAVEAVTGWIESPDHCKNLMNPKFKEVGLAHYHVGESHYRHYWTQDLGTKE